MLSKKFGMIHATCWNLITSISFLSLSECDYVDVPWGEKPGGRDKGMAILAFTTTFGQAENFGCW